MSIITVDDCTLFIAECRQQGIEIEFPDGDQYSFIYKLIKFFDSKKSIDNDVCWCYRCVQGGGLGPCKHQGY